MSNLYNLAANGSPGSQESTASCSNNAIQSLVRIYSLQDKPNSRNSELTSGCHEPTAHPRPRETTTGATALLGLAKSSPPQSPNCKFPPLPQSPDLENNLRARLEEALRSLDYPKLHRLLHLLPELFRLLTEAGIKRSEARTRRNRYARLREESLNDDKSFMHERSEILGRAHQECVEVESELSELECSLAHLIQDLEERWQQIERGAGLKDLPSPSLYSLAESIAYGPPVIYDMLEKPPDLDSEHEFLLDSPDPAPEFDKKAILSSTSEWLGEPYCVVSADEDSASPPISPSPKSQITPLTPAAFLRPASKSKAPANLHSRPNPSSHLQPVSLGLAQQIPIDKPGKSLTKFTEDSAGLDSKNFDHEVNKQDNRRAPTDHCAPIESAPFPLPSNRSSGVALSRSRSNPEESAMPPKRTSSFVSFKGFITRPVVATFGRTKKAIHRLLPSSTTPER